MSEPLQSEPHPEQEGVMKLFGFTLVDQTYPNCKWIGPHGCKIELDAGEPLDVAKGVAAVIHAAQLGAVKEWQLGLRKLAGLRA